MNLFSEKCTHYPSLPLITNYYKNVSGFKRLIDLEFIVLNLFLHFNTIKFKIKFY